jgi:hypothetical protein
LESAGEAAEISSARGSGVRRPGPEAGGLDGDEE